MNPDAAGVPAGIGNTPLIDISRLAPAGSGLRYLGTDVFRRPGA